jgi:hypothetical protein
MERTKVGNIAEIEICRKVATTARRPIGASTGTSRSKPCSGSPRTISRRVTGISEETHLALFQRGAPRRCGLRRCSPEQGARPAGKSARPRHPQTLAAALGCRAAPGCGRTYCADRHCGRRLAGCTRGSPLCGRDGPRLRRWRTFPRFHQQGLRVSGPHRLGARGRCAAERGRPDGGSSGG